MVTESVSWIQVIAVQFVVSLQIVKLLQNQPDEATKSRKGHILLGRFVCQHAFRKLLQIGSGRYTRLRKCALTGQTAPLDGRTIKKKFLCNNKASAEKRALIVEYLTELHAQVSEPMPEANQSLRKLKDDAMSAGAATLALQDSSADGTVAVTARKSMLFRRHRGRRPRGAFKFHRGKDQSAMRLLPPGSYSDYLMMLRARHPQQKFSLKLFTNATCHLHQ